MRGIAQKVARHCALALVVLNYFAGSRVEAQIHTFSPVVYSNPFFGTNYDGATVVGGMAIGGNTLYGTTYRGGYNGIGIIFSVNTDGTGFTNLHNFSPVTRLVNPLSITYANAEGGGPKGTLLRLGNTLYGTCASGGINAQGSIFAMNTDGSNFRDLFLFTGIADGANPQEGVICSGDTLYGTTENGGVYGYGIVYSVKTNGGSFRPLHNFSGTNSGDGSFPCGKLLLVGNTLYGTAASGGSSNGGTLFAISNDGTGFTNLYNFAGGVNPHSDVIFSKDTLYGTGAGFGVGAGVVYSIKTNGTGYTNIISISSSFGDGSANPYGGLVIWDDILFGVSPGDANFSSIDHPGFGPTGAGVYCLRKDGSHLSVLIGFVIPPYTDNGLSTPILAANNSFYVANQYIIGFTLAPSLRIATKGSNVVVSWPTNVSGGLYDTADFTLQSSTNPSPSATWTNVTPAPVAFNGNYVVTNALSATPRYYRLAK